jgi:hypothetical protein
MEHPGDGHSNYERCLRQKRRRVPLLGQLATYDGQIVRGLPVCCMADALEVLVATTKNSVIVQKIKFLRYSVPRRHLNEWTSCQVQGTIFQFENLSKAKAVFYRLLWLNSRHVINSTGPAVYGKILKKFKNKPTYFTCLLIFFSALGTIF